MARGQARISVQHHPADGDEITCTTGTAHGGGYPVVAVGSLTLFPTVPQAFALRDALTAWLRGNDYEGDKSSEAYDDEY